MVQLMYILYTKQTISIRLTALFLDKKQIHPILDVDLSGQKHTLTFKIFADSHCYKLL